MNPYHNEDIYTQKPEFVEKYPHPKFDRTVEDIERLRNNRVGLLLENKGYNLFQEDKLKDDTTRRHAFMGTVDKTLLNQVFMSNENLDLIQSRIQYEVYQASKGKYKIGRQNDLQLQIIMRSIYFQYGKNRLDHIREQVQELNNLVVQDAVPKILSQVEQHIDYLRDASQLYIPISQPVSTNSAGRKTLPSVTSTFF